MLNKEGSSSWKAGSVAEDEDIVPIVYAIPLPQETNKTNNLSVEKNDIPVISLPDCNIVSSDQHSSVEIDADYNVIPEYDGSQTHNNSATSQQVSPSDLKQERRDCRLQAKTEWKQLKKSLKQEAKFHKQILKEQHGVLKQQWKCQKRALKGAYRGCEQTVTEEARLWRGIAREESRVLRDSFHKMKHERVASIHRTKQDVLDLSRLVSDLLRF
jgi:hypothetical protein